MKNLILVAGARPNFVKIAPIIRALQLEKNTTINYKLVHTGQHYDDAMSGSFFKQLEIPEPDINLGCGGGTQAQQTASIMVAFEAYLMEHQTDWVLVVGDVTSTMACTIAAKKLCIQVAHVEAGIRSGDLTMPEEINRMVTDSISDVFFTTSQTANDLLAKNGIGKEKIIFVGNTMIDSLLYHRNSFIKPLLIEQNNIKSKQYVMLTLHRPSNVDDIEKLSNLLNVISNSLVDFTIIFPVHPRTKKNLHSFTPPNNNILFIDPLSYLEFNYLVEHSNGVITDSGGITEETTVLGIPCITLRNSTERPETCTIGTNLLVGDDIELLKTALKRIIEGKWHEGHIPPMWDGRASERIVEWFNKNS